MTVIAAPPLIDGAVLRQRVRELPALPQAAMAALAALRDEHSSAAHCAELIARDQALTARTLRLANSAFYGVPGRVANVRDAVHMLGRRTLGAVLTVATVSQQFDLPRCPPFCFASFWRHAIGVALAARGLARLLDADEDLAFTVGLLHDIGQLALAAHFPAAQAAVILQARERDLHQTEVERELLGTTHVSVGAQIATHWQFPADVVAGIAGSQTPPGHAANCSGKAAMVADIVHAADAVVHALDLAHDPHEMVPTIDVAAWNRLALPQRAVLAVFADTERGVHELCKALGL